MKCKEAHKLVVHSQDERLGMAQRIRLRLHLLICSACTNFERQMAFLREACRRFPDGN
ncbi:MAG: anti-sigma factor [Zoogloea sp.]|nr:anti-sigma factor [Zoogloea sp.]